VTKLNLIEVASYANMSKDATELGINRIIKYISEKILTVLGTLFRVNQFRWRFPTWVN
jgi:hypothetical protein